MSRHADQGWNVTAFMGEEGRETQVWLPEPQVDIGVTDLFRALELRWTPKATRRARLRKSRQWIPDPNVPGRNVPSHESEEQATRSGKDAGRIADLDPSPIATLLLVATRAEQDGAKRPTVVAGQ